MPMQPYYVIRKRHMIIIIPIHITDIILHHISDSPADDIFQVIISDVAALIFDLAKKYM